MIKYGTASVINTASVREALEIGDFLCSNLGQMRLVILGDQPSLWEWPVALCVWTTNNRELNTQGPKWGRKSHNGIYCCGLEEEKKVYTQVFSEAAVVNALSFALPLILKGL